MSSNEQLPPQEESPKSELVQTFDEWSGHTLLRRVRAKKHLLRWSLVLFFFLLFWFVPFVPKLSFGNISVIRWTKAAGKVSAKVGPAQDDWAPLSNVSKHFLNAVVVAEDDNFYEHHGFDWDQIHRSIETNIKKKSYKRGASTITQQVVKMAFLTREKTLIRKAREATGAALLEAFYSKQQIIEWYVNLIEFGDNIYGIKSAAKHYFQTKPAQLTIAQSIHLALVIPSPNKWSKGLRQRSLTPFGHSRFLHLATAMRRRGYITEEQWRNALATGDFGRPIAGTEGMLDMDDDKLNNDESQSDGDIAPGDDDAEPSEKSGESP